MTPVRGQNHTPPASLAQQAPQLLPSAAMNYAGSAAVPNWVWAAGALIVLVGVVMLVRRK